jgi:polysaccharide biosynthesis/export protein
MKKIVFLLFISVLLLTTSCVSKKKIIYFQGIENQDIYVSDSTYEHRIEPDDMIAITITSEANEAALPFNQVQNMGGQSGQSGQSSQQSGYLVDFQGFIEMPILGKIQVGGMKKSELKVHLLEKLSKYIQNPIIDIRISNFKVTVLGEVGAPGTISFGSDRLTLPEALAQAGDFKIPANRQNVLVIRDESGVKKHYRIDLTSVEALNSPVYYLKQNDLVYVEPRFTRSDSTAIGANLGLIISITSFVIAMLVLINQ